MATQTDIQTDIQTQNVCILVNSCSKYRYILHPFFIMWKRWWKDCKLPMYLACDGDLTEFKDTYGIHIIEQEKDYGFVEGRIDALKKLDNYDFVIMLQDDFIIERYVDNDTIDKLMDIIVKSYENTLDNEHIACIRLMPCPGPEGELYKFGNGIELKEFENQCWCKFSFQAAIWNRHYYIRFFEDLIDDVKTNIYKTHYKKTADKIVDDLNYWNKLWFKMNIAENEYGSRFTCRYPEKFLGIIRDGKQANAVYKSPIPYRPTAIVRSKLEPWARDLFKRENIDINH